MPAIVALLAGNPPTKERSKSRVEQPDVETENDDATRNRRPGRDGLVHQGTHEIPSAREDERLARCVLP